MSDQSNLDKKYFIDNQVYNCPFCNRNNVAYEIVSVTKFDWSDSKKCYAYYAKCSSCNNTSMHLSFEDTLERIFTPKTTYNQFKKGIDIDSTIFYSTPTSFFTIDNRIPRIIRELVTEAEGCLKMNYLTGSSACVRKAIYEMLIHEKAKGGDYQERIKSLKAKYPEIDPSYFDILAHIQDMTSDRIHEQSWDKWDSPHLTMIIETLKTVLYDIYVLPQEKRERYIVIQKLQETIINSKKKTLNND